MLALTLATLLCAAPASGAAPSPDSLFFPILAVTVLERVTVEERVPAFHRGNPVFLTELVAVEVTLAPGPSATSYPPEYTATMGDWAWRLPFRLTPGKVKILVPAAALPGELFIAEGIVGLWLAGDDAQRSRILTAGRTAKKSREVSAAPAGVPVKRKSVDHYMLNRAAP